MKLVIEELEENNEQLNVMMEGDVFELGYLHYEATKQIIAALKEQGLSDEMVKHILSLSINLLNELGGN